MPRYRLSDMDFDEVSTVDKPANQYSRIVLAKRHQEDGMPPEFDPEEGEYEQPDTIFDADGNQIDPADLEPGDQVLDADGNVWEWPADDDAEAFEPELVGKSAFLDGAGSTPSYTNSVLEGLSAELSKALDDEERTAVVSKAVQGLVEENAILAKRVGDYEQIAKRERAIRLEREYFAKADSYGVPIDSTVLGPVLMRMAEALPYADCAVIDKALTISGEIYNELGRGGESDVNDPFTQIEEFAAGSIGKRDGMADISKEQATVAFFESNPDAYNEYRREQARS